MAGLLPHGTSIIMRWVEVGHGPYINMYEVMSSDAWVAMAFYLIMQLKYRFFRKAAFLVIPVVFLSMGFGIMSRSNPIPLPPSLRSYWLILHVIFAKLCSASFLIAFGLAGLYLYRNLRSQEDFPSSRLPSPEKIDILIYKFNLLGFAFLSIMIIAGSIWANNAWGRYWAFDPVETWSLITWLAYGLFLHLRLNRNWVGRASAYLTIVIFTLSILSFFFIPYFLKTVHSEYLVR
jgi:cytochrome c-type biogenesis protein CcsB